MISTIKSLAVRIAREEEGASLVEYVLLVALIAVVCIAVISGLGLAAKDKLSAANDAIKSGTLPQ